VTFTRIRRLALMGLFVALAACASKPPKPPKPTALTGTIVISEKANPTVSQRPSPLLLRVYELKSAAAFNSADFMALYQRDQAELAADLMGREEYMLAPGESKQFKKALAPETRFLGVLAAYRDLENATWRTVIAVQPSQNEQVLIQAGERAVEATLSRLPPP
jgi:type VI secretion system protein VasD